MKKAFLTLAVLALAITVPSSVFANETETTPSQNVPIQKEAVKKMPEMKKPPIQKQYMEKRKQEFEKRLKLTDEQKLKAKEIQEKGREEMKPLMEQIKLKREEIRKIENSFNTDAEKKALIEPLRNDVRELNKKAHQMRVQNMKKFESILDKKQLKELEKMKQEGRKKFEKNMKKKRNEFKPPFLMVPNDSPNPEVEIEKAPINKTNEK